MNNTHSLDLDICKQTFLNMTLRDLTFQIDHARITSNEYFGAYAARIGPCTNRYTRTIIFALFSDLTVAVRFDVAHGSVSGRFL